MKKIIALFLSVLLLALASAAFAKPAVTDFRNNNYDYSTIKMCIRDSFYSFIFRYKPAVITWLIAGTIKNLRVIK